MHVAAVRPLAGDRCGRAQTRSHSIWLSPIRTSSTSCVAVGLRRPCRDAAEVPPPRPLPATGPYSVRPLRLATASPARPQPSTFASGRPRRSRRASRRDRLEARGPWDGGKDQAPRGACCRAWPGGHGLEGVPNSLRPVRWRPGSRPGAHESGRSTVTRTFPCNPEVAPFDRRQGAAGAQLRHRQKPSSTRDTLAAGAPRPARCCRPALRLPALLPLHSRRRARWTYPAPDLVKAHGSSRRFRARGRR